MILQALVDYYERKRAIDPESVPPSGWEYREVAFYIEVDDEGKAILIDRRTESKKRGDLLLVPAAEIRSGSDAWKKPNLLWDHMGFVLGQQKRKPDGSLDTEDRPDKVANQFNAFRARIKDLLRAYPASEGLRAIERFYARGDLELIGPVELRESLYSSPGLNLTFRRRGHIEPVCHESWVASECRLDTSSDDQHDRQAIGQCLLTGKKAVLARLHPKISFVTAKPSPLVSANTNEAPAYSSYGKQQALIAPVSLEAASLYTLALNALTGRESANKVQVGDATTVMWTDRDDSIEPNLAALFGDNPDAHVAAVRDRLAGAKKGIVGADTSGLRFFVLGLAPNASRIAVRFWIHETFDRLGSRILRHFDDLRIVRQSDKDAPTPAIRYLLKSIAIRDEDKNIPPRLAGEWMRAILSGTPYPPALLNVAVNRCRAEQATDHWAGNVSYLRAAILKACINREHRHRYRLPDDFQFIQEELDMSQIDPAYRLGRLFAALERIQAESQGSINATIRDRYYGSASSTPGAVFPTLMRLKNSHLKKLGPGKVIYFEKLIGEICGSLENPTLLDFPRQFDIRAQGLFALGYYHQRQSFYTRRDAALDNETIPAQET